MIAILTDFGTLDPYVGIMKGVLLGINSNLQIIDLTHAVSRHAIREGAFLLATSVRYFPAGTVFLAVVDPGVGSARRPLAAEVGGYHFVGPDNGLLSYALAELGGGRVVELTESAFRLPQVSYSFHGRDIFAPAAAYLSLGTPLEAFGPPAEDYVRLPAPRCERAGQTLHGEVLHIDSFGNLVASIGRLRWRGGDVVELSSSAADKEPWRLPAASIHVHMPGSSHQPLAGLRHSYSDAAPGEMLAMVSSAGYLEVSCAGASAAQAAGAAIGDPVELRLE